MKKNILVVLAGLASIVGLAACSAVQGATQGAADGAAQTGSTRGMNSDPASMSLEQKLAIGTLMLENGDQAVTKEQAAELLPLWKAIKSLANSDNAAQQEMEALYKQIEGVLSADQLESVKTMTWTEDDMSALREKYGAAMAGPGGGAPGGGANLSDSEKATRQAQFKAAAGSGNSGGGGGMPGGGMPGGGGGGMPSGGGMPPDGGGGMPLDGGMMPGGEEGAQGQTASTPSAAQLNRQTMGFNSLFADAVIQLLSERTQ